MCDSLGCHHGVGMDGDTVKLASPQQDTPGKANLCGTSSEVMHGKDLQAVGYGRDGE